MKMLLSAFTGRARALRGRVRLLPLLVLLGMASLPALAGTFTDEFAGPELNAVWESYIPKAGPTLGFNIDNNSHSLRVELPATSTFNLSGSVNAAPQIRMDAPDGPFDFQSTVNVTASATGTYHAGLFVLFGTNDAYTWGPFKSPTQLRLEKKGAQVGLVTVPSAPVSLRIRRAGSQYTFYYRTGTQTTWTLFKTDTAAQVPLKLGLITRTTSSIDLKADFSHFRLDSAKFNIDTSQGSIKANVMNGTTAVTGPWLLVKNDRGRQVAGVAVPAESGRAAVFNLPPGVYTVKAVHPWIDSSEVQTVSVTEGRQATVNLQVVPCPNFSLLSNSPDLPLITDGTGWKLLPGPLNSDNDPVMQKYKDPVLDSYTPEGTDAKFGTAWVPKVRVPQNFGGGTIKDNSVFWYRLDLNFPAAYSRFTDREWILSDFNIDDEDDTFFNGTLVGQTKQTNNSTQWDDPRDYRIPGQYIKPGAKNVIAIRGFQGPGAAGMSIYGPRLRAPSDSDSYVDVVAMDKHNNALSEVTVKVTSLGGAYSETVFTENGRASFPWLPEGDYLVQFFRPAALDAAPPKRITVTSRTYLEFDLNVPALPYQDLRDEVLEKAKAPGWKFMSISADKSSLASGDVRPANPEYPDSDEDFFYGEDWFWDVPVPADLGAGSDPTLPIQDNSYFWYRFHVTIPQGWADDAPGRDLRISNFSVDDSDWTYFNGKLVGATPNAPGLMRSYQIPRSLVRWDEDNVIAIKGYQGNGAAGITDTGFFALSMDPVTTFTGPAKGDLNGDTTVDVQDVSLGLQIVVGLQAATPDQMLAGDVDDSGAIEIEDIVAILRYIVGIGTL